MYKDDSINNGPKPLTAFREQEKKYKKYHKVQTDFSDVLFHNEDNTAELSEKYHVSTNSKDGIQSYTLAEFPGFTIYRNLLPKSTQFQLTKKALTTYMYKPFRTNLTTFNDNQPFEKDPSMAISNNPHLSKLHWATLGYQFEWTERRYPPEWFHDVPEEILQVSEMICGHGAIDDFDPQSIIVNYYGVKSTMLAHKDDVEIDYKQPVVSLSFGLSSIYLLGGDSRDVKPVPVMLRAGDVCILGGQSRMNYHGVPRIFEDSFQRELYEEFVVDDVDREVLDYLDDHRINMNFRQVFPNLY